MKRKGLKIVLWKIWHSFAFPFHLTSTYQGQEETSKQTWADLGDTWSNRSVLLHPHSAKVNVIFSFGKGSNERYRGFSYFPVLVLWKLPHLSTLCAPEWHIFSQEWTYIYIIITVHSLTVVHSMDLDKCILNRVIILSLIFKINFYWTLFTILC